MTFQINEDPKRLEPTKDTVRYLFALSGNLCAFPACNHLMIDTDGNFIGQICHIEAALQGGERFNVKMTNEQRRAPDNLMLMCYEHHVRTNDVFQFDVAALTQMKAAHERRFAHPDRAILATLTDWTRREVVSYPSNVWKFIEAREWGLNEDQHQEFFEGLTEHIKSFQKIPVEVRQFFGAVVGRIHYMQDMNAKINHSSISIPVTDIENSLRLPKRSVATFGKALQEYGLGEISESSGLSYDYEVFIWNVEDTPFWLELCQYCIDKGQRFEDYFIEMNFSGLEG